MNDTARQAERTAARAENSRALQFAARAGFVMNGLVHLLIGWIALQLAFGSGGGSADQSGALGSLAQAPGGRILLGIGALGMAALALWCLLEAWFEPRRERETGTQVAKAVSFIGKAVVFAALGITAAKFALGGGSSSSGQSQGATSTLLASPGGKILVVILGLVVIGIGGYHIYKGATRGFEEDLQGGRSGSVGTAVTATGMAGFIAKGIALLAVGAMFTWAGFSSDAGKASGLDGALKAMTQLPAGTVLLALVGIGLALYGVFCFFRARYEEL